MFSKKIFFIDLKQDHEHLLQIIQQINTDYLRTNTPFHIAIVNKYYKYSMSGEEKRACIKIFLKLKDFFKEDFEMIARVKTRDQIVRDLYSQKKENIKCELSIINENSSSAYGHHFETTTLPDDARITEYNDLYQFTNYSYNENNNIRLLKSQEVKYDYKGKNNINKVNSFRISHLLKEFIKKNIGHKNDKNGVYYKFVENEEPHKLTVSSGNIEYEKLPYNGFRIDINNKEPEKVDLIPKSIGSKVLSFFKNKETKGAEGPEEPEEAAGGKTRKHRKKKMRSSKRKASKKGRKSRKKKSSSRKKK